MFFRQIVSGYKLQITHLNQGTLDLSRRQIQREIKKIASYEIENLKKSFKTFLINFSLALKRFTL